MVHRFYQLCALSNKVVAALGHRAVHRTGDGKYLSPLLQSQPCRNQGTAFQARFYHQNATTQTTDNTVSAWKMAGPCWRAWRIFRHQYAMLDDSLAKTLVLSRVNSVNTRSDHRNGRKPRIQCTRMGRAVYAQRKATGNNKFSST